MQTCSVRSTEMGGTESGTKRSSFGATILAGLATAGLMAVAASQTWLHARVDGLGVRSGVDISGSDGAPLALALALVALAGWGVILVSGSQARRIASVIGLVATIGALIVVVTLWPEADEVAARVVGERGGDAVLGVSHRPWHWITAVAGLAQLVTLLAAFRDAPTWPTMSSRYDAPTGHRNAAAPVVETGEDAEPLPDLELWKALDEGRDPTEPGSL